MKNIGKGIALFIVILVVTSLMQILIGFEDGAPYGIATSLSCIIAYFVAIRFDAVKSMLGVSIFLCVMAIANLGLGDVGGFFMLIGPVVTLILSVMRIKK